ncbi:hypothetical protein D1007_38901 [Hordeum vulgare]|nr:hypothetical protein D1007_38901 [Hordeum vulgare]
MVLEYVISSQQDVKQLMLLGAHKVHDHVEHGANAGSAIQISEVRGDAGLELKVFNNYTTQLPPHDIDEEIVPTPPLVLELNLRFSQHNVHLQHMDVDTRATVLSKSKNMEGTSKSTHTNSFVVLSHKDLLCRPSKMGVMIPDNEFSCVDVLRELEVTHENLGDKLNSEINSLDPNDITLTMV